MATIQVKRGATAPVAAYTPAAGEFVLDTTTKLVYIGDGTTVGGILVSSAPLAPNLTALAGLSGAADQCPYFTGAGAMSLMTVTAAARTLLDDTSTTAMRTTLGAAPLASPTFTGTPAAPTQATATTSSTQIATCSFVQNAIAAATVDGGVLT